MGIELKGWYMLAKEGEPSFRFTVNANACNPWDLIVVVPWVLSNVLSGSPVVHPVFIDLTRYTAEQRNYYWQYEREAKGDLGVILAEGATTYPVKSDKISDKAKHDPSSNFGRLARYGIMEAFVKATMNTPVRGLPAHQWLAFFKRGIKEPD
ncbi:MAG: hypothetical protein ACE5JD_00080 [Candidatus Methylomirabilia bacterium]